MKYLILGALFFALTACHSIISIEQGTRKPASTNLCPSLTFTKDIQFSGTRLIFNQGLIQSDIIAGQYCEINFLNTSTFSVSIHKGAKVFMLSKAIFAIFEKGKKDNSYREDYITIVCGPDLDETIEELHKAFGDNVVMNPDTECPEELNSVGK